MSNWIRVKDALPENGQFVIIYLPEINNGHLIADKYQITHAYFAVSKFIEPFSETTISRPVTHWMRLPEPPQED